MCCRAKMYLLGTVMLITYLGGTTMVIGEDEGSAGTDKQNDFAKGHQTYHIEEVDEMRTKHRLMEHFARNKYKELDESTNGELQELFSTFSSIGYTWTFFENEKYPGRYQVYQEFLIQVFENVEQGDVDDAMFANFVMSITPHKVILETIVPELGPGGRLEGILDRPGSDLRRYLEKQPSQGSPGDPDFYWYGFYLDQHRKEPLPRPLIEHMFRADPGRALLTFTGLSPRAIQTGIYAQQNKKEVKELLWAEHVIGNAIWKQDYGFLAKYETDPEAVEQLRKLASHKYWWARRYAAEVMRQHRELRQPQLVDQLREDLHALVRKVFADDKESVDEQ